MVKVDSFTDDPVYAFLHRKIFVHASLLSPLRPVRFHLRRLGFLLSFAPRTLPPHHSFRRLMMYLAEYWRSPAPLYPSAQRLDRSIQPVAFRNQNLQDLFYVHRRDGITKLWYSVSKPS